MILVHVKAKSLLCCWVARDLGIGKYGNVKGCLQTHTNSQGVENFTKQVKL